MTVASDQPNAPIAAYDDGSVRVFHGDSQNVLPHLPADSIDAIVTDPPYGLSSEPDAAEVLSHWLAGDDYHHRGGGFMGRTWDSFVPGPSVWREAYRVLKPGGHALVFSSTRTYDLTVVALRLAGFEVRDSIHWTYGQGFPKSLDIAKALAKTLGASDDQAEQAAQDLLDRWDGWGTALKPAHEMIALVRKPFPGTVAANITGWGTGGLNIDACRITVTDAAYAANCSGDRGHADNRSRDMNFKMTAGSANDGGRHPTNFLLTHSPFCLLVEDGDDLDAMHCVEGCPVKELDGQSGVLKSGANNRKKTSTVNRSAAYGAESRPEGTELVAYGDSGGASRFFPRFKYEAKAKTHERITVWIPAEGCRPNPRTGATGCGPDPHDPDTPVHLASSPTPKVCEVCGADWVAYQHPTVKPLGDGGGNGLMGWLVRLITPVGGTVLDLYAGTGPTGVAARSQGFGSVLIERDPVHVGMTIKRLTEPTPVKHPKKTSHPVDRPFSVIDGGKADSMEVRIPKQAVHGQESTEAGDDDHPALFAV